jgi:hypothetical protein
MKISAQSIQDFNVCHLTPGLTVYAVRCDDPKCDALHGFVVDVHFLFWIFGVVIHLSHDPA